MCSFGSRVGRTRIGIRIGCTVVSSRVPLATSTCARAQRSASTGPAVRHISKSSHCESLPPAPRFRHVPGLPQHCSVRAGSLPRAAWLSAAGVYGSGWQLHPVTRNRELAFALSLSSSPLISPGPSSAPRSRHSSHVHLQSRPGQSCPIAGTATPSVGSIPRVPRDARVWTHEPGDSEPDRSRRRMCRGAVGDWAVHDRKSCPSIRSVDITRGADELVGVKPPSSACLTYGPIQKCRHSPPWLPVRAEIGDCKTGSFRTILSSQFLAPNVRTITVSD